MIRPIVPIKIINSTSGEFRIVNGMIDSGADRDVINGNIVKELGIRTTTTELRVVTVDNSISGKRELASFTIESLDGSYATDIRDALVGRILTGENDIPPCRRDLSDYPHISDIQFPEVDAGIEIIVGAAHVGAWLPSVVRRADGQSVIAMKSTFGWTMAGKLGRGSPGDAAINAIAVDNEVLRQSLERIFYQDFEIVSEEEMGESKTNKDAIQQLAKSIRFCDAIGKYVVGLPWSRPREEITALFRSIDSRSMAMRRLRGMIPRFKRDPARKERVFKEVQKFFDTGVATEVDNFNDDASAATPRWYLPLHVVEKGGKTRVCHDARSSAGGYCLNDFLLGGPNLVNSLAEILMYARKWKFVIMNDIKAFYHQIRVDPDDVDAFRFPWFADENLKQAIIATFLSHVFGSGASAVVTAYTLRHHAERLRHRVTEAVYDMIRNRYYVDDGTGGANTPRELLELSAGVKAAMEEGGFELCKFKSNLPEAMEGDGSKEVKLGEVKGEEESTKVLGVSWIPTADVFTFNYDTEIAKREIKTPRELVSVQASLYDPLGLISPFQLEGRKLLQRCEAQKRGWDSPLEQTIRDKFEKWSRSIPLLGNLRIPRWWNNGVDEPIRSELHLFSDAAPTSGYGAAAYRRVISAEGEIKVILLCSRSHVVPLNPARASHHNSTPRLELTSNEKAVELRLFVERSTQEQFDRTFMWTDSEAALKMINDATSRFRLFFANRLSKIHAGSKTEEWRHVDSENNPADFTSRGIAAHETEKWTTFHFGPQFLYQEEENWPKTVLQRDTTLYVNAIATAPSQNAHSFFIDATAKCSTWFSKLRRIAFILRLAEIWRKKATARTRRARDSIPSANEVTQSELTRAENLIIKDVQYKHFALEIDQLTQSKVNLPNARGQVDKKSKSLRPHNPFIDQDGILRVGSRILNANIDHETKFPIILPPKDDVTKAIIRETHIRNIHAGPKATLAATRQRFWINKGLQAVKSSINVCASCQRRFKAPLSQKMGALPAERVNIAAPFEYSGVDLAGPFEVKMNGRANHKIWIAVFTCAVSRAVHAEIVYKLDADSMINAIIRFSSRRPGVKKFTSDRGTNLTGAEAILRRDMETWNASSTIELQKRGLQWEFIPARTPHYGGYWERIVAMFKKHLCSATRGDTLHVDTFNTIVVEIENIINRRPLTAISDDPSDMEAITPAHILYPATFAHSSATITTDNATNDGTARASWKRAQHRVNAFWKSWSKEYLTTLHSRSKWRSTKRDLCVGDLVIIVDESVRRHEWKMGRIVSVEGSDDHIRRAWVKRGDGKTILKDRTKIVLLEIEKTDKHNLDG